MFSAISRANLVPCARPQAWASPVTVRQAIALMAADQRLRASRLLLQCSEPRRFCLQAFEGFRLLDHEAGVAARADLVELVLHLDFEYDLASLRSRDPRRHLDGHAHQRRGKMLDRHFHPHRVLARIGMLKNELATGMLDVENHGRGRIGARLVPHEGNGAFAADLDSVGAGYAWTKAWLHDVFSFPAV